jgi:hypothetical protein
MSARPLGPEVTAFVTMVETFVTMVETFVTVVETFVTMVEAFVTMVEAFVTMVETFVTMVEAFVTMVEVFVTMVDFSRSVCKKNLGLGRFEDCRIIRVCLHFSEGEAEVIISRLSSAIYSSHSCPNP